MRLAGIDLAWHNAKNPSAVAIALLRHKTLTVEAIAPSLEGPSGVADYLISLPDIFGISIDAPLIINNTTGQRPCERLLSVDYGSRHASCHTSNLTLYPHPSSVAFSEQLKVNGYEHLGRSKWQLECYPHPAIIECFNLPMRLKYKKGSVVDKKRGQIELAGLIKRLAQSSVLKFIIPNTMSFFLNEEHIHSLSGRALKENEDALDALICVYIAGLFQLSVAGTLYGDTDSGYIWVPQVCCI
ncbi:MAG: DUF429 domain-containing protein [Alkalimonas sp.]|nr:DUF429 domain-containing protein [Alkalimonas sp.]